MVVIAACGARAKAQTAAEPDDRRGIFFGANASPGTAVVRHPDLDRSPRVGFVIELQFGVKLGRHVSLGGQFTTWGSSALLTPYHLHTLGPRIEIADRDRRGPFFSATLGEALTEGNRSSLVRAGGAAALAGGYAFPVASWVSLAAEGSAHGHLYANGNALLVFAGLRVRFHGFIE